MNQNLVKKNIFAVLLFSAGVFLLLGCTGPSVAVGGDSPVKKAQPRQHGNQGKGGGPPPWAPAHGYRAKYEYRYYPSAQVYFDVGRAIYFYYADGDWRRTASRPGSIQRELGDAVTLEMDTDRPYQYHSSVRENYPPGQAKGHGRGKKKEKAKDW